MISFENSKENSMNSFGDIFELMKTRLDITDTARELFINPIKPIKLNNKTAILFIANDWVKQVIQENYDEIFKKHLRDILGFEVDIKYVTNDDHSVTPEEYVRVADPIPELDDDPYAKTRLHETEENSNYKYTFDTFIVGESNRLACAACRSIAQGKADFNPLYITSDRPPKEINDIETRLITRFEWGLLTDIAAPEFETRLAIIKRKAELMDLKIPNNVMEYMADKLKNNIRQIEGAIVKMYHIVFLTGTTPTIIMAQNIIKDVMTEVQPVPVTVEHVITDVSHIFNVSAEEMRSKNRNSQVSTARQVAMYVISKVTDLSYTSIGKEFGGRDHSTVVYATNKVKKVMQSDPAYRATVEDLIKNISNV